MATMQSSIVEQYAIYRIQSLAILSVEEIILHKSDFTDNIKKLKILLTLQVV